MLAITYPLKRKRIKVAKWGTPKNIKKKKDQYPDAAKVVIDETYMDDSITSKTNKRKKCFA
jgi:hypothetical protein